MLIGSVESLCSQSLLEMLKVTGQPFLSNKSILCTNCVPWFEVNYAKLSCNTVFCVEVERLFLRFIFSY